MAEGSMSPEAVVRRNNDIRRQEVGMAQAGLRQEAGIHDFRPGDTKLTPADQAAFNARLKATQRRESVSTPKGLLGRLKDLAGI